MKKQDSKTKVKKKDGMYNMSDSVDYVPKEMQSRYDDIIGSLSLFAPLPNETDDERFVPPQIELERPVTPIDLEIKAAPSTLDRLQKFVRRRIQPNPSASLTVEKQLELAGVIMGQVSGCWPDLRTQIDYPFFDKEENHELNRRIVVHIVTVCEELLKHFTAKAEVLSDKQCFSDEANMTRLKSELTLEAHKYLHILNVRRYISNDMKEAKAEIQKKISRQTNPMFPDLDSLETVKKDDSSKEKPSFKKMIEISKPKDIYTGFKFKTVEQDLNELRKAMPTLDNEKLLDLLESMPDITAYMEAESKKQSTVTMATLTTVKSKSEAPMPSKFKEVNSESFFSIKRSDSLPELHLHSTLAEDLDITITDWFPCHEVDDKNLSCPPSGPKGNNTAEHFSKLCKDTLDNDLCRLMNRGVADQPTDPATEEDDLPPLIQATQMVSKDPDHFEKLTTQIQQLDEKKAAEESADLFIPEEPKHVQPVTILKNGPAGAPMKLADVRPERRECVGGVTLDLFSPVWNDLCDEISQATVKQLDSNLFLGEETREVYREIMKTVSRTHLDFTSDSLVQTCPEKLDLSGVLASASLHRRKADRVVNPKLHKSRPPPWNEGNAKQWGQPHVFAPGDKKGAVNLEGVVDGIHRARSAVATEQNRRKNVLTGPLKEPLPRPALNAPQPSYVLSIDDFKSSMGDAPKAVQERLLRSYQNWLAFWRGTLNPEDYMKFVSTQETDYLTLLYHLYDSDEEEELDDGVSGGAGAPGATGIRSKSKTDLHSRAAAQPTREMEREKERQERLDKLRAEKSAFRDGEWNVQSVTLGGLGVDPLVPEEELPRLEELAPLEEEVGAATQKKRSYIKRAGNQNRGDPTPGLSSASFGSMARQLTVSSLASGRSSSRPLSGHTSIRGVRIKQPTKILGRQERLERLWTALRVPDSQRLDMAIKYAGVTATNKGQSPGGEEIESALVQWETAAQMVLKREALIVNLEMFERQASDPHRFFAKGSRGSSKERLHEAKKREKLYAEIENAEDLVREAVLKLEVHHNDTLTYQGRPYLDKMKWDRVEMLYWLQEERRQFSLMAVPESRVSPLPPIGGIDMKTVV